MPEAVPYRVDAEMRQPLSLIALVKAGSILVYPSALAAPEPVRMVCNLAPPFGCGSFFAVKARQRGGLSAKVNGSFRFRGKYALDESEINGSAWTGPACGALLCLRTP